MIRLSLEHPEVKATLQNQILRNKQKASETSDIMTKAIPPRPPGQETTPTTSRPNHDFSSGRLLPSLLYLKHSHKDIVAFLGI